MINTLQIKQAQLKDGYFKIGNGNTKILVMGSCRVAPIVGYLHDFNKRCIARDFFTIYTIDPFNWNWDTNDERVDYIQSLRGMETHLGLLDMLKNIDYFVHEFYQNAEMFNCNKSAAKNIYQFGLNPRVDICIPNFNDVFILFKDIVNFDVEMRKKAQQDWNVLGRLSEQTQVDICDVGRTNLAKFYDICIMSDLPLMQQVFEQHWQKKRFFWTYNHVSKNFTVPIFHMICEMISINLSPDFLTEIYTHDMFANNYTHITEYDLKWYNLKWGEEPCKLF